MSLTAVAAELYVQVETQVAYDPGGDIQCEGSGRHEGERSVTEASEIDSLPC